MHRLFLIEASNNISIRLNVFIYVLLKIVDRNRRVIQVRKMLLTVLIQLKLWLLWSGWENYWILKSLGEGFQSCVCWRVYPGCNCLNATLWQIMPRKHLPILEDIVWRNVDALVFNELVENLDQKVFADNLQTSFDALQVVTQFISKNQLKTVQISQMLFYVIV